MDIAHNISITATGGGEAAANLMLAQKGLEGIHGAHQEMKGHFAERFEHIGLHMFGRQLFELAGIHGHIRPLVQGLSLAMTAAGGAAGLAAAPFAVLAGTMAALVGWMKSHKEESETELRNLQSEYAGYRNTAKGIDDYAAAGGRLSEAMRAVRDSTAEATSAVLKKLEVDIRSRIASEESTITALKASVGSRSAGAEADFYGKTLESDVTPKVKEHQAALEKLNLSLEAVVHGYASASEYEKAATDNLKENAKAAKEAADAQAKLEDEIARGRMENLQSEEKSANWEMDNFMKNLKARAAAYREEQTSLSALGHVGQATFNNISQAAAGGFSKMIVESKSWAQAFDGVLKKIEEQFITMLIEMAIKWAAFQALTGGAFGMSGIGANALLGTKFAGGQASGGDYMVSSPTVFLAGEAGPERATFTPMGGGGGGGGGGGHTYVFNVTNNVQAQTDPAEVGREIVQQIRGLAQIDFVRKG